MVLLARLDAGRVEIAAALPAPDKAATLAVAGVTVYLPLAGLVDLDAERKRMQGELDNIDKQVQRIETTLEQPRLHRQSPGQCDRARATQTRRTAGEARAGGRAAGGVVEIGSWRLEIDGLADCGVCPGGFDKLSRRRSSISNLAISILTSLVKYGTNITQIICRP
jgi:hypothetical protein